MWISGREAAQQLTVLGIDRESARRVLAAGVAGPPVRTRGSLLFELERVSAVVERAAADVTGQEQRARAAGRPVFVGRLQRRTPTLDDDWRGWSGADLTAPETEQRLAASGWWRLSRLTQSCLSVLIAANGPMPFVGVVSGLAVVGGEAGRLCRDDGDGPERACFVLDPAGPWFDDLRGRMLRGPGGGAWFGWPDGLWSWGAPAGR